MIKFDSTENLISEDLKLVAQTGSFFGPFPNKNDSILFFLSLSKPMEYDVDKYEYEENDESIQEGHIFALISSAKTGDEGIGSIKQPHKKTHIREKRNLGAKLKSIDVSNLKNEEITLQYGDGDACGKEKYQVNVTLVCDKRVSSLTNVEYLQNSSTSNILNNLNRLLP
jgi:hypothetical protein